MANFIICGGGPERPLHIQNWTLARTLAASGHEVTYVVDGNRTELVGQRDGYSVRTWPAPSLGYWRSMVFFWRLLREKRPDAVLANFFAVYLAMPVALFCRVKVRIAWYRDLSEQWRLNLKRPAWKTAAAKLVRRFAYGCATHVAPVSFVAQEDVGHDLGVPANKCRVFHTCRPPSAHPWQGELLVRNERKKILCVGQLWPSKGQDILIRALKLLRELEPGMKFTVEFLGDGPFQGDYERLVRELGLEQHVSFGGRIPHAEVFPHMASAHVMVLPYRTDASPGVIAEGLSVGVPLLVSASGALPELLGDSEAAWFVPPEDPAALAKALQEILINPRHGQLMSEKARLLFQKKFHLDHWINGVQRWLEEIMCSPPPIPDSRKA